MIIFGGATKNDIKDTLNYKSRTNNQIGTCIKMRANLTAKLSEISLVLDW